MQIAETSDDGGDRATITVPQAARRLGISKNLCYALAAAGQLPVLRLGRRIVVPLSSFEAWLANRGPSPN